MAVTDRRSFLKSVGALAIVAALPRSHQKSGPIRIAAANASSHAKAQADYLCNGRNDHEVFQKALREVGHNPYFLLEGDFYMVHPLNAPRGFTFDGQHKTTFYGARQ